ncbi:hypothetical protein MA16_Dca012222 [Dendrobium catenatum]|uniref:Ubiquitin-like domain-containing protein n=1 Tax=Dendrobium catenatum TaxID=906689 RepID=A0A2I0VQ21_9ASPA|nr:hypothetical protein MA16_Dca012222 [Dendrobium catenatum]
MDVTFETDDGRRFQEEIWFFSPVREIKEKLHKSHGIPVSRQTLCFNGIIMEDEHDFEYYNVIQGSVIRLHLQPEPEPEPEPVPAPVPEPEPSYGRGRGYVKVTVLMPRVAMGIKRLEFVVNLDDKVGELRKELLRMEEMYYSINFPPEGFFFIHKGNVMEEDNPYWWHDVKAGDVIEIFSGIVTPEYH